MKDQDKCFILAPTGYEEITYAELQRRIADDAAYAQRRFIPVHGTLMEVSEAEYRDFYKKRRRQKYLDEEAARVGAFSYNALDTDEFSGEDILVDDAPPIDTTVSDKLMLEALRSGLDRLSEDDRELITALFFEGKSERELARERGVPDMTLNYRKRKILAKLKTLMGF